MGNDPYSIQRCVTCGSAWRDANGNVIHPTDTSCYRYIPDAPPETELSPSIAVNMPGKYDPRHLRRNPGDTFPGSPSFKVPKDEGPSKEAVCKELSKKSLVELMTLASFSKKSLVELMKLASFSQSKNGKAKHDTI